MRRGDVARGLMVAVLASVLMTGTSTSGEALTAGERGVKEEVLQNNPDDATRTVIRDRLISLINGAQSGTDITIASYHLDDNEVANALIAAANPERKLRIRLLIDAGDREKPAYQGVADAIKTQPASMGSWLKHCGEGGSDDEGNKHTSCMGTHIMHNKFFLFENTSGSANVVVQTSANLNAHSGTKMWNTAYVTADEWLYDKYQQYFEDLQENLPDVDYYNTFRNEHGPVANEKFAMYVSPRVEGNTFLDALNDVRCGGNTSGGTSGDHRTIVRVAAMQIAGDNGIALAKRLWELDNQGCYVDIVANEIKHRKRETPRKALDYLLARPRALPPDMTNFHGPEVREFSGGQCGVHQKNILIDGFYGGKPNQKVVFTGSHNMNDKSPRHNDEVVLRIIDDSVHNQFREHFFTLRAGAAITWQTSKFDVEPKRSPRFEC